MNLPFTWKVQVSISRAGEAWEGSNYTTHKRDGKRTGGA